MADFDPLKDYAYGDLNPLVRKGGRVYRDNGTTGIDTLKQIAGDSFKGETVLGTGPYKAICLRIESAILEGRPRAKEPARIIGLIESTVPWVHLLQKNLLKLKQ